MKWFYAVLLFVVVLVVHELGHIITLRYYTGRTPAVRLKWYAVIVGGEPEDMTYTLRQGRVVAFAGILTGLIPVVVLGDAYYILVYLLMSILDFMIIIQAGMADAEYLDVPINKLKTVIDDGRVA